MGSRMFRTRAAATEIDEKRLEPSKEADFLRSQLEDVRSEPLFKLA